MIAPSSHYSFEDELCNTVTNVYLEGLVAVVDEQNVHEAPVVGVDNARPSVNAKLSSKPATWGDVTVGTQGNGNQ